MHFCTQCNLVFFGTFYRCSCRVLLGAVYPIKRKDFENCCIQNGAFPIYFCVHFQGALKRCVQTVHFILMRHLFAYPLSFICLFFFAKFANLCVWLWCTMQLIPPFFLLCTSACKWGVRIRNQKSSRTHLCIPSCHSWPALLFSSYHWNIPSSF